MLATSCASSPEGDGTDLATDLAVPWGLDFLPTGEALVAERDTGRVLRVPEDGGEAEHVATVPGVEPDGEGGLLGLAVSPTFADDSFLYAYLTSATDNRIVRFRLVPDDTEPVDVEVVVDGIAKSDHHDGGRIAFGPDGMLYAGTGDAGDLTASQDTTSLNGKILRMTPVGEAPPDNPIPGSLVYTWGHRNVQGLAWDSDDRLWATEFGQDTWDEVNLIEPGQDYGWPEVEGDAGDPRFVDPQVTWRTDDASPSGAAIVPGADHDTLYVAALRGQRLWQVPLTDGVAGEPTALLTGQYGRLRTVALAPDGSLWVATSNRDGRGDPADGDDRLLRYEPAA